MNKGPYVLFLHGYASKTGELHPYARAVCKRACAVVKELEEEGYDVKVAFLSELCLGKNRVPTGEVMAEWMTEHGLEHRNILFRNYPVPGLDSVGEVDRALIAFVEKVHFEHCGFVSIWGHHFRLKYLYWRRRLKPDAFVVWCCEKPWKLIPHLLYTIANVFDPFGQWWWSKAVVKKRKRQQKRR